MRTNIEIDEKLMDEILQKTSIKTKKEAVDIALREFLRKSNCRNWQTSGENELGRKP